VFRTDVSLFSFGQEMSVVIIDNGDGTCSADTAERVRLGGEQADRREADERGVVVAESPGLEGRLRQTPAAPVRPPVAMDGRFGHWAVRVY
jgi:hypothetical protein